LPLIYFQMKRTGKVAEIVPVVTQLKRLTERSKLPKTKKWFLFSKLAFKVIRQQKLKALRLVMFNFFHFPILITFVWTIRRLLVEESVKKEALLWIPSLCTIDPFYITPFVTIAAYYWNLQRFITKENQHTLISRLKSFGQGLLILWLPILCNWPAAIVWYMLTNAMFSIFQTSLLVHPAFFRAVDPKMMLYQFVIRVVEYDKKQSQTIVDAIKTGEESYLDKSVEEEQLVENMKEVLQKMNAEKYESKESMKTPSPEDIK